MVRKTRRKLRGGQDKYSPLAKRLMTSRHYEKEVVPGMRRGLADIETSRNELMEQAVSATTPDERQYFLHRREMLARGARDTERAVLERAGAAKSSLRGEFESSGGKRRKTRRRYRGGQDKYSPLAKKLMVARTLEKEVTPAMREKAEIINKSLANLDKFAAMSRGPHALRGIEGARARILRNLSPAEREAVASADLAKAQLKREYESPGGTRQNGKFLRRHTRRTRKTH